MTARLPFTEHSLRKRISALRKEGLYVKGITADGTILVSSVETEPSDVPLVPAARHNADASRWGDE